MAKYLYGAAVQGIQGFILESKVLREITGGSEFVEQICTKLFRELVGADKFKEENLVLSAAGNIRYVFEDKKEVQEIFRIFPFKIQSQAPGITVSQAIVELEDVHLYPEHINTLIERIDGARNQAYHSFQASPMLVARSHRNGNGAMEYDKEDDEFISRQQAFKRKIADSLLQKSNSPEGYGQYHTLPEKLAVPPLSLLENLDEISGSGNKKDSWIAVIHADGNGLGRLLIEVIGLLNKNEAEKEKTQPFYQAFSVGLDTATRLAAQEAMHAVYSKEIADWKKLEQGQENLRRSQVKGIAKIPFRPVLLGGDDLTAIVEARTAFKFTQNFMAAFEHHSKEWVFKKALNEYFPGVFHRFADGLTTCAGIAYIKPNYPFHYAEAISQKLCKAAKKASRKVNENCPPSSLQFHLVQSSFIDAEWSETLKRELTLSEEKGRDEKYRLTAGPYFLKPGQDEQGNTLITLEELDRWLNILVAKEASEDRRESVKSKLRALLTEYELNPAGAAQYEKRIRQVLNEVSEKEGEKKKSAQEILAEIGVTDDSIFRKVHAKKDGETVVEHRTHIWDLIKLATVQQAKKSHSEKPLQSATPK